MNDIRCHFQWRNEHSKFNRHHSLNHTTGFGSTYYQDITDTDNIHEGILCNIRPEDELRIGDEITTTTSGFHFDCLTGTFDKEARVLVEITAEHLGEDYTEYVPGKDCTGGCYGYDHWKVLSIEEVYQ